jgi:hypothetical protein
MHFLNSDDVVAVLDAILPYMDANTAAMPPWNENKGVKIGYFLCIITEKSINCETPTEY